MNRNAGCREGGRCRGISRLLAGVCIVGLLLPGGAAAMQATPSTGVVAQFPLALEHDLAAMVLPAEEFPVDGLASARGRLIGPEQEARIMADSLGMDPERILAELEDTGWVGRYAGDVALPSESDPSRYGVAGSSYVTEYEDEDGAAAGFALLEDEAGTASEDLDAPAVGDESELTRTEGVDAETGTDYVSLDFTFRSGNFVAGVGLTWFDGAPSKPVNSRQMARASERLLERIDTVAGAREPNLFGAMLRLDSSDSVILDSSRESYDYLDGTAVLRYGETEELVAPFAAMWEENGVERVYSGESYFLPANAGADAVTSAYVARVYSFGNRRDARGFVDIVAQDFVDNGADSGYTDIQPLDDLPAFDGAIAAASYTYPLGDGVASTGHRVWFQVDTFVVSLEADGPEGVDADVLYDLMTAQAGCIEDGAYCAPIAAPAELAG